MTGFFLEDLSIGQAARFAKTVSEADLVMFAGVSGDTNPLHLDEIYARRTRFKSRIAHGMLSAGFISAVLGTKLPGPGCIYMSQMLNFRAPVRIGDTVEAVCTVKAIDEDKGRVTLDCRCLVDGKAVVEGEAVMLVPRRPAEAGTAEV